MKFSKSKRITGLKAFVEVKRGYGSHMVKVSDHDRHVTSLSPVLLKTPHVAWCIAHDRLERGCCCELTVLAFVRERGEEEEGGLKREDGGRCL
ncbi:hypothetical protein TNCV_4700241 [Trichonephila clavipes]|nr:hypothetical protein TNCV_4700241 [Trichonephila clavipes]